MAQEATPLTMISEGKEVILLSVEGGLGLRSRLTAMGLKEGMKFKVLNNHKPGPCIILAGGTRLVLGHGMAQKIFVKKV